MRISRGDPMPIARGYPFAISGVRFRTSAREVYEPAAGVTLRIGAAGSDALIEVAMEKNDTNPDEPSWYLPSPGLTAVQTALLVGAAYVGCCVDDATGHVLLEWPVPVRALPL